MDGTAQAPVAATPQDVAQNVEKNLAPIAPQQEVAPPAKTADEPQKTEDDLKFSSRFAALSRRERELQKKEAEIKRLAQDPLFLEYQDAKKSKNPIKALQALGMSYKDATDFVLNDEKPTQESQIKALMAEIEELKTGISRKEVEKQQEYVNNTISGAKTQIRTIVDTSGDAYELIRANEAYDTVWEVIEESFAATGQVPKFEDALNHVESYLEEQAKKLLGLKKLAPKPPVVAEPKGDTPKTDVPTPQKTSTLTNNLVSSAPAAPASQAFLSDEESKARSAALLRKLRQERQAAV